MAGAVSVEVKPRRPRQHPLRAFKNLAYDLEALPSMAARRSDRATVRPGAAPSRAPWPFASWTTIGPDARFRPAMMKSRIGSTPMDPIVSSLATSWARHTVVIGERTTDPACDSPRRGCLPSPAHTLVVLHAPHTLYTTNAATRRPMSCVLLAKASHGR